MNGQVKRFQNVSIFLELDWGRGVRYRLGKAPFHLAREGLTEQIPYLLLSDRLAGVLGPRIERWFRAPVATAVIGMQTNALSVFRI